MNKQRTQLVSGEIYHVISRTVGDTVVFDDENDFYRGIFSIYEFNNDRTVNIWKRRRERSEEKLGLRPTSPEAALEKVGLRPTSPETAQGKERDRFVEVLAFSFMPNHLHLILRQLKDNGTVEFMKKVNGGYAKYFNEKYSRKGHLYNRFKAVHVADDIQLKTVFTYVHTNLISLIEPGWKEKGIENPEKVKDFLENNKRHSYPDYLGQKNFPSITQRDFLLEIMGGVEGCRADVGNWIDCKKELRDLGNIILE
jgi:putative transposase